MIFLLELVGAILAFVFSSEVKQELTKLIQEEGLLRYRDDADFQSLVDWIQETVSAYSPQYPCQVLTVWLTMFNPQQEEIVLLSKFNEWANFQEYMLQTYMLQKSRDNPIEILSFWKR